jgi:hypothetical protein
VGRSTTSRQTATAAETLEVDVPTRHEDDAVAAVRDGHPAIVPWIPENIATRKKFSSQ